MVPWGTLQKFREPKRGACKVATVKELQKGHEVINWNLHKIGDEKEKKKSKAVLILVFWKFLLEGAIAFLISLIKAFEKSMGNPALNTKKSIKFSR